MYNDLWSGFDKLVSLVMQNQAERAIELIESGTFDKNLLSDVGCCKCSLPLYKLSLFNAILLSDDGGSKEYLPEVERNRQGCKDMLNYWEKRWGYPINVPMGFFEYQYECAHFKDWDMEELLDGGVNELTALGYDENEIEFCYAVLTYKSDLIQKHIKMQTNPDVYISGAIPPSKGKYADGESYNALDCCSTFYCDAFVFYGLGAFWSNTQVQPARVKDVHLLLEAAAYCDLEKKLKELKVKSAR